MFLSCFCYIGKSCWYVSCVVLVLYVGPCAVLEQFFTNNFINNLDFFSIIHAFRQDHMVAQGFIHILGSSPFLSSHNSTAECSAVGSFHCIDSQSWQDDMQGSKQSRRSSRFKGVRALQHTRETPGGGIFHSKTCLGSVVRPIMQPCHGCDPGSNPGLGGLFGPLTQSGRVTGF